MMDLYNILGVDKNSDNETIRRSYRKLAAQLHPDKNKAEDAEIKFKELNNAYGILSDPEKRERYDRFGIEGVDDPMANMGGFSFPDIFNSFNGFPFEFNFNNNSKQLRKKDINIKIPLSYEEIYSGCSKTIQIQFLKKCNQCNGSGGNSKKCNDCNGHGRIRTVKRMGPMMIQNEMQCNKCNGTGEILITSCLLCNGRKNIENMKELNIDIPAGIKEEHVIIKQNGGHEIDNVNSDLKINIEEKNHEYYKRDDKNIKCKIHISLLEALVGYEKEFILLDGSKIMYNTKQITKPNTKLRLKGYGFCDITNKNNKGDMLCYITIDFPEKIDINWIEDLVLKTNDDIQNDNNNNFEVIIDK
jgi:molecular chaperone DnaJ